MSEDESEKRRQEAQRRKTLATGIGLGVGIGSAALAAAMLYARGSKKKDDGKPPRTSTGTKTPVQEGNRWTD